MAFTALVIAAGIAGTTVIVWLLAPSALLPDVAVVTPLTLAALVIARTVTRRLRHHVIVLGMIAGLLPVVAIVATTNLVPSLEPVSLGSMGLVPLGFAIVVPLERRPHLAWVIAANVTFFVPVAVLGGGSPWANELPAVVGTAGLASTLSLLANELQMRRRVEMNGQLMAMRGLYGRMKDHELDLRRQDEFLFMQQETLVVQQAELLRLNEELETIARLDALTGLGNRLRLNEDLAQVAARIERIGGSVGLLLMDLDRFKRLNDVSGHLAGDAALRGVADVLRKTSRVGDGLYRYGGEEFLVILHDCDDAVLESAGQRYISAVEAAGLAHPDNPPWDVVTASAGARELSQRNCIDIDAALHDADEALYVAKAEGRNRLVIHRPAEEPVVPLDQQRAAS